MDIGPIIHYHAAMFALIAQAGTSALSATATSAPADMPAGPWIEHPAGVLAVLLAVLAIIFWLTQRPIVGRIFKVVPALVFCYFVPTTLTTLGIIPDSSPLYNWVKDFVLPASLLLLVLSLDVPGILRLGPKAVTMLLAGTAGVVIGGPISLAICNPWLPDDVWQGMAALAGSWIGGGANFVAIGQTAGATDAMLGPIIVVDVFVASIWMGTLLYLSGHQNAIDNRTGANAEAIRDLERRMTDFQQRVTRVPSMPDLMMILALGFVGSWVSYKVAEWLPDVGSMITSFAWKFIIVTALGIGLSFTRARNLEGAGASKIGTVMIYLLVACIGAGANFAEIGKYPAYVLMGFVWMACHVLVLLGVGRLIRAPLFFVAVGSQSNIGGAASAPVVASAFHPSLAPVGALLAVAGYVLGTYAGLFCMQLLKMVA